MEIALLSVIFVLAAGLCGKFFSPTEEQTRPLAPEPGSAAAHDDHGHHH
jgi:hypothetical protein